MDIREYHRARRFEIMPAVFPMLFASGTKLKVVSGIPDGAKFRGFVVDPTRNILVAFIEHESFELIHQSMEVPLGERITLERIEHEATKGAEAAPAT